MFGLLNEADTSDTLDPAHYAQKRGRFYLIWNATKTSGRPMLVALMAGNAAHAAEETDTHTLLCEINERLRAVFQPKVVPAPIEVIVTRWKRDPFTRGTYSYVAPETRPGDYDLMSKPVGNLHFAGEATCGTHPATVHGAFLSGLRVAAEVVEAMAGPVTLPNPLVGPAQVKQDMSMQYAQAAPSTEIAATVESLGSANVITDPTEPVVPAPTLEAPQAPSEPEIKQEPDTIQSESVPAAVPVARAKKASAAPRQSVCAADSSFWVQASYAGADLNWEAAVTCNILTRIGERPPKPARPGVNPFLLFTKDKWEECKAHCASDSSGGGRDAIRQTLGRWWRALPDQAKQPYLAQSQNAQELADTVRKEYEQKVAQWDADARKIRDEYMVEHPPTFAPASSARLEAGVGVSKRKTNVSNCVVLDHA